MTITRLYHNNFRHSKRSVRSILLNTTHILESLHEVTGVHSVFLSVDPGDPKDKGFLGGTVLGREFWRSLRGGGDIGFRSFKVHCHNGTRASEPGDSGTTPFPTEILKRGPASSRKAEVYTNIRSALRQV